MHLQTQCASLGTRDGPSGAPGWRKGKLKEFLISIHVICVHPLKKGLNYGYSRISGLHCRPVEVNGRTVTLVGAGLGSKVFSILRSVESKTTIILLVDFTVRCSLLTSSGNAVSGTKAFPNPYWHQSLTQHNTVLLAGTLLRRNPFLFGTNRKKQLQGRLKKLL